MGSANNTLTKRDMIERISERTGLRRAEVKEVVQEFLNEIINELGEGRRIEFREFGVFEVRVRAPRIAQNPKTLERVDVPEKHTIKFKAGRRMKEVVESRGLESQVAEVKLEPKVVPDAPDDGIAG